MSLMRGISREAKREVGSPKDMAGRGPEGVGGPDRGGGQKTLGISD